MKVLLLLVVLGIIAADLSTAQTTRYAGSVSVENVDLLNVFTHPSPANNRRRYSILASTYSTSRATYDPAVALVYPGEHIASNFSSYRANNIFNFLYHPKEIRQVPRSVFGSDAIVHCDGTTTNGKTDGSVHVSDVSDFNFPATYGLINKLVPIPDSYKFHSGVWFQVDGDSRDDFVTCRVDFESGMLRWAQLVWLEHPRDGFRGRWSVNVLKESACDTNLAFIHIRNGLFNQDDVVYTTGFHTRKLAYFWTDARNWNNPDRIQGRILDQGRQYYDVTIGDFNRDGKPDLLVTVVSQSEGSVEVWEIPESNFQNPAAYTHRVIATGFNARNNGVNGWTPKTARPFYPTATTSRKPWIFVSGGDDGRAYYLMPNSEQANNWEYQKITVADYGVNQEVSGMAAADVDGDGYTELFVSAYKQNRIDVYTFRP